VIAGHLREMTAGYGVLPRFVGIYQAHLPAGNTTE
jgi:hypothetical protein